MTRTSSLTRRLTDDEFVMVGDASSKTENRDVESNDLKELKFLALQMVQQCTRLLPPRPIVEQAVQTDDDAWERVNNEKYTNEINWLKKKLKEVVDMNVGWQLIHDQQEKRLGELMIQQHQRMPVSQDQAAAQHLPPTSAVKQEQASLEGGVNTKSIGLETWQTKCGLLEHDKRELEATVSCLTSQLESTQELLHQLELTVDQQQNKLDSVISEKQSFIDMLQDQILVYREDFECERKDRETAQGKIADLKVELELLKQRLAEQPSRQSSRSDLSALGQQPHPTANPYFDYHQHLVRVPPATMQARYETPRHYYSTTEVPLIPRQPWYPYGGIDVVDCSTDGIDGSDALSSELNQKICTDGVISADGMELKEDQSEAADKETSDALRCPNCQRRFTIDQHVDLMDHMDVCVMQPQLSEIH